MNKVFQPRLRAVVILIAALACGSKESAAQGPSGLALDLSSDTESPGSEITLRLSLRVPEGVQIAKAESEITYPGQLLAFREARPGSSAKAVGAEVSATRQAVNANFENSVLRITISAKPGGSIPAGTLASLIFKISENAPSEGTITLNNKVSAWTPQSPSVPVQFIAGKDGEVKVIDSPPIFACFFYMH
ncbi:MAG: hypothetical protein HY315_07805 [Acidobacteria bacterium]|nr:hypothetical protein [Acidobacteriota bacterium]